jgi:DNA repair ATPase RecN
MPRHRKSLDADDQIEAMTRKLASLDQRLANLEYLRPKTSVSVRELRTQRDKARIKLLELVELAEMPPEFMGWA